MSIFHHHDDGDAHHQHQMHYNASRFIGFALFLTGAFAIVEVIASFASGSLALLSDAGHMITDSASLGLADLAQRFDRSLGYFWHATHQQIYRELARMEALGWVASLPAESGRGRKRAYQI